ncbi:aldehyde-activating protein [Sphingopyxis flava]|uniref:aldehyde-activating protein n=1 Tax=Sphingopyxis flava TaxID=1507287 RepID=UPI0015909C08|nr:aldehyde-activating protein [Sphingopyxis flava]
MSIRLAQAPEEIAECNCSLCFSHGILWAYYSPRDVVIVGETRTYNRADRESPNSDLHFCPVCGCTTHWAATEGLKKRMGGEAFLMGVNMRLFAPAQLSGLKLCFPDGRSWSGEGPWDYARVPGVMP